MTIGGGKTMSSLGKLTKITDLRTVWKHEEKDFSVWLAKEENLKELSNEIGIDIVLEERESSVGGFSLDIFAYEDGTNRKIIIENQLEDTNHDHLGKIITYAAGKDAEVIIWIVKRAREEHRQAVDWLNQHTDEKINVFLVEIELWQINDSLPAPKFQVVAKPNDWAKVMKKDGPVSDIKQLQLKFWLGFVEYAKGTDFTKYFALRKCNPQHWYSLAAGLASGVSITLTVDTNTKMVRTELYISDNKELFNKLYGYKNQIESELGFELDWQPLPDAKASRVAIKHDSDIKNESAWNEAFKWFCEKATKMKVVFNKYNNL